MERFRLRLARIAIPFRASFRHAAAERATTESVWVEARARDGAVGYGEACPRPYVTGEDLDSVKRFFARHQAELSAAIGDLDDLIGWTEAHGAEIDHNPAAWCAIELALLDALARRRGVAVEALLGLAAPTGPFRYSAVVGAGEHDVFRATVERYRGFGFSDFKLKLCGDLAQDRENLGWMWRSATAAERLRLDANNLWATADDAARYLDALACPTLWALEEPLVANRYAALAALGAARGLRIVLDESCARADQVRALDGLGERWIVNVRVSKMGGILRSLQVVEAARRRGIPVIVGAQVGETSLLTRAALTVAAQARDLLVAQEGAFGTFLLSADVCDPSLMFGAGGVLEIAEPHAPGFGVAVNEDRRFLQEL
jgi:L-alanine-DL-glutamate epimerase-like enolase superfamily enzyme